MKVTLYLRIRAGYKYVKPVWQGKHLKALYGVLNGVPTHFPDALGYYIRYRDGHARVCENVGLDPTDAVTFLRRRQAILAGVKVAEETPVVAERRTITSAIADYMKWLEDEDRRPDANKNRAYHLRLFLEGWHKEYIDEIERSDIVAFKKRMAKLVAPATVNNRLMTVVVFFKWAGYRGLLKSEDLSEIPVKPHPFTEDEVCSLMEAANDQERLLFRFFLVSGCRDLEVAYSEYDDLGDTTYEVRDKILKYNWKPKKTSSARLCPLSPDLMADLRARQAANPGVDLIFPNNSGRPNYHLLKIIKRVAKRAGLQNAYLHRFRDTFATRLLRKGRDLITVARRLGHKDLKTLQSYAEAMKLTDHQTRQDAEDMDYKPQLAKSA